MKQHQTLRRGLGILLSLAMCLTLLPATALAEGSEIKICGTTLEEGTAYAPNDGGIMEKTDETNYLEYNAGELIVYGNVTVASADNVLKLESGDLTINCPADSSLTLDGQNSAAAVSLQSSTLTLTGAGDVTIQGSETAVSGGTLKAESYSGDLAISAAGNSATVNNTVLNLDTTGNISITGSMPVAGGLLTVTNAADVTITGSVGNLLPDGSVITDTGSISIESESNMVVNGLTVNNAEKVALTGDTTGPVAMSVTLNNCESWDIINKNQTSAAPLAINITVDGTTYGNCYGVTVTDDGNGTASASLPVAPAGTNITLSATPDRGYRFKEWQVAPDTVTINDNQFTMPGANVTVQAVFESIPSVDVAIDEANFPDKTFREYVSDNFDEIKDNVLSDDEIAKVTSIDCNGSGITNLKGIEYFTELQNLYCYENNLTTLDISNNTKVEMLDCDNNQLTKLDLSNNTKLESLSCGNNQLTKLDLSKNKALGNLFCSDNQLTSLDLENTKLDFLLANDNSYEITLTDGIFDLTELESFGFDVSKATDWTGGTVEGNTLTVNSNAVRVTYEYDCGKDKTVTFTLRVKGGGGNGDGVPIDDKNFPDAVFRKYVSKFDTNNDDALNEAEIAVVKEIDVYGDSVQDLTGIAHFTELKELDCAGNQLTTLDISNNTKVEMLDCDNNSLTKLKIGKNESLTDLYCSYNQLTTLDVSQNTGLINLQCEDNNLTYLDVSSNEYLSTLYCSGNQLTTLDVSKNTSLTKLDCSENKLTFLDLSNTQVSDLSASDNVYEITLNEGRTFDLSTLPGEKFNVANVSSYDDSIGTIDNNTAVLTLASGADEFTYSYNCGKDKYIDFTLKVSGGGGDTDDTTKYTVTASGIYNTHYGNEPGETFTLSHAAGENVSLLIGKRDGYTLKDLTLVGISENDITWAAEGVENEQRAIRFTMPANNVTITVNWTANSTGGGSSSGGGGGSVKKYSVTASENIENGTVTISPKNASAGSKVTVTVTPDEGYALESFVIKDENGKEIKLTDNGNGKYTFTMPSGKVTVEPSFKAETAEPVEPAEPAKSVNPFTDVPSGAYYEDAVIWAVEKGITSGTTETTFSPDASCTRAQMLTFMWRAAGSPKATGSNPFTDVSADAYYYDAVLWAVENGITSGISATTFAPDATVTRDQTVTFLYRMAGSPAANGSSFSDVSSDAYYADAVAWAVQQNITSGTGDNQFSPNADCTRAQIVTFLYRYMG